MRNVGLALLEALVVLGLAVTVTCLIAAIAGVIRFTTRTSQTALSVLWLMKLGIFAGVPFSVIGMIAGYMTGASRVSAISAVVPAALTLVGAAAVYLFGKGGRPAVVASFAVINFCTMMLIGVLVGGYERLEAEQLQTSVDYKMQESDREYQIYMYRRNLGLPPAGGARDPDSTR